MRFDGRTPFIYMEAPLAHSSCRVSIEESPSLDDIMTLELYLEKFLAVARARIVERDKNMEKSDGLT